MRTLVLSHVLAAGAIAWVWTWRPHLAMVGVALVVVRDVMLSVRGRGWFQRLVGMAPAAPYPDPAASQCTRRRGAVWLGLGLAATVGAWVIMEARDPYFFTQDDSFCQGLPVILQGCRSFFSGVFPQWNPYQLVGAPTSCLGVYGLTYPPTYLAYAVSRFGLGNEYYTLEVLALLHLVGGYVAMYWAARTWGMAAPLAMAAGLSYALSGYGLIAGRSWCNMLNVMAWIPVVFGAAGVLKSRPVTWKWAVGTGLAIGLFFHAGFVQVWVYVLAFLALVLGALVLSGALPVRRALWAVPAFLVGIAVAAPLLYVQMHFASGTMRAHTSGGIMSKGLLAMLLPPPLVQEASRMGYKFGKYMQAYYSGTLFCAVGALTLAGLTAARWSKKVIAGNIWLFCAVLALVLAFGDKAYLWPALCKRPWLGKFKNAERFLALFNGFIALGGGIALQRVMAGTTRARVWAGAAAACVAVLMLYHVSLGLPAFWVAGDKPYPALPASLEAMRATDDTPTPQRAATLMPMHSVPKRSMATGYPLGLEQNFASAYSILTFNGYDPLVWNHAFSRRYFAQALGPHKSLWSDFSGAVAVEAAHRPALCKAYGIRWLVLFHEFVPLLAPHYPELKESQADTVCVATVDGVSPLAFAEERPEGAFPIRFSGRGAVVDVSALPQGGPFIVNILAWPDLNVYADGRAIPFAPDKWGRVRVDLPSGVARLEARYSPPWAKGIALGLLLASVAAGMIFAQTVVGADGRLADARYG